MKYRYVNEFEAEDDEEAADMIWNERHGVSNSFDSIHHEELLNLDSDEKVVE